jgi:hypothetical protein
MAIAVLLFSIPSTATTVPRLELPDLVHSAELIVHGRIVHRSSAWDPSHQFIWTHYVLLVTDALKGHPSGRMTISEPGGAADGVIMKIAGVPEYSEGEEVVVFLHRTPIGYWRSFGLGQGKYTVSHSAAGQARIYSHPQGVALARRPSGVSSPLSRFNGMTLEEFRRMILREVRR